MECEIGKRRRNKVITGGQSSRYIPEEIILNILRRLPIKARGRFRCISKQWYKWIPRRFKFLISVHDICYGDYGDDHTSIISIDQNMDFCNVVMDQNMDFCNVVMDDVGYYYEKIEFCHLMGSCNGLVLVEKKKDFFLWNPSTGYFGEKLHIHGVDRDTYDASGLCFDSNNGDYKAVIALSNRSCDIFVMVCSFKTKTWTRVKFPCENGYSIRAGPVLNDCLHWFVDSDKIIYFNPKKDELVDFPTPDLKRREIKEEHTYVYGLCALDGYLCMVCNILNMNSPLDDGRKFEILIMKEYGVKESWEILFKIEQGIDRCSKLEPLFYTEDSENVVIRTANNGFDQAIKAFDRNGKLCSDVNVVEFSDNEAHSTIVYEETLAKPTW